MNSEQLGQWAISSPAFNSSCNFYCCSESISRQKPNTLTIEIWNKSPQGQEYVNASSFSSQLISSISISSYDIARQAWWYVPEGLAVCQVWPRARP
jgi:hypothetical protein